MLLSVVGAGDADEPAWVPRRRESRTCAGCVGEGREGSGEWMICGGGGGGVGASSDAWCVVTMVVGGGGDEFLVK